VDLTSHGTAFGAGLSLSLVATPAVRKLALHFNICAFPTEDRWHNRRVPLLGGVAIATGLAAGVLVTGADARLFPLFLYSGLMFALGVYDDVKAVKPLPKLCGQMVVAAVVLWLMPPIAVTGWAIFDRLLAFVWIVGVTNAFNLLDNMDGLAAGVAAIAAACYLTLLLPLNASALTVAIAAFSGAVLGFLFFNFPPATVFMGDSGSLLIGGFLATAGLGSTSDVQSRLMPAALFPVLILLVPILDTAFVTFTRSLSGRSALAGGRDHTSHRLVALGVSERTAVLSLYALAAAGGGLAVALRVLPLGSVFGFVTLYLLLLSVAVFVLAAQGRDLPAVGDLAYRRRALEILVDLGILTIAYYAAFRIRFFEADAAVFFPPFVESIPLVVGSQVAALYWAGKYRLPWRAPVRHQLGLLGKALSLGMVLAMMIVLTLYRFEGFSRGVFGIDLVISWLLLVGTRAATSSVQHYLRRQHAPSHSTLIYGAGGGGKLVLRELSQNRQLHLDPVGFIDDDASKQRMRVDGIPVLGTSDDLEIVAAKMSVAELIISVRQIDNERIDAIRKRCATLGIRVRRMRFNIDELRPTPTVVRRSGAD
jgi:UDP-GlcNAc:undecaprenyl-phosphate/decaprenyl-phosphate GlcNAc-1-phosphate transferase